MKKQVMKVATSVVLGSAMVLGSVTVPANVVNTVAAAEQASIHVAPIDSAKFLAGAKFDFRVELNHFASAPKSVSITINGKSAEQFFGKSFDKADGAYTIRDVSIDQAGMYTVSVQADNMKRSVTYEVVLSDKTGIKAKNVIFFNGDGMGLPVITAARILAQGNTEGKYNGYLAMDQMDVRANVVTSGIDSIVTDSANSASAYATGHKAEMNALGVYPDNTEDTLDNPKVETIVEMVKRARDMSTGIVSTAEIQDASPAAGVAHTRARGDKAEITEMFYQTQPDVILGGGAAYFIPKANGGKSLNDANYFDKFEAAGYTVVENRTQLMSQGKDADKLLGMFHPGNMDVYYDREMNTEADVVGDFDDQPALMDMTQTAIDVLSKDEDGFFLMVEAGSIDKMLHPLDWERAVLDAIEFDQAIAIANKFAEEHGDTLVVVTADHAHSMSITGTYWEGDGKSGKNAVRTYQDAMFPTYEDKDGDGFPDEMDVERKLAVHFGAHPDYYEDYKMDAEPQSPAIKNEQGVYVANPGKLSNPDDADKDRFLQVGPINASTGVHTVEDVPLMAHGIGSEYFGGTMDNTEVFYGIAHALGLDLTDSKETFVELRTAVAKEKGSMSLNAKSKVLTVAVNGHMIRIDMKHMSVTKDGKLQYGSVKIVNGRTLISEQFAATLLK